ncbi:hypothetical protein HMPREF0992_02602 [Lachnospiraceae bacterium 6_1_63FAA]|nr:hypothetical protein HMPREF0992_02602 [Lachnospiraceae bacterium 6_1_63FAA]
MQLRSKYYTYPVITDDVEFYVDSRFTSDVEQLIDGYNVKLKLKTELVNPELEQMLLKQEVLIAHHIECTQTCYRKVVLTNKLIKEYLLRDGEVNGSVQVCTFLVAAKDIQRYSNSLFAPDFRGFRFNIERGCIMAVGNQINLRINKIKDDLTNTASIFSIIPNMDETVTNIVVDTSGNKIVIAVPQETYSIYSNMSSSLDIQPVMHSMLIIPALVYALTEVKEARTHLYDFEDYRWYRSLRKAAEKMNISFNEDTLANINPFDCAQKLMDSPIPKAVNYLRGDNDEED